MRMVIGQNSKGITLIEALVSIVIVGIGLVSVLQLSVYAVRTAEVTLQRNKVNFLSEMMMETLVVNQGALSTYALNINDCNVQTSSNGLQKIWLDTFTKVLDTNTKTTRCLVGDKKVATINSNINATINFTVGGGQQKKYLGFSKIE
jgi:Tfp pilus assembly protein PilV